MILAIGAFSFATNQLNFGIDFESGRKIDVALGQPTPPSTASATRSTTAGVDDADAVEDPAGRQPRLRHQRLPDPGDTIPPEQVGDVQNAARGRLRFEGSAQTASRATAVGPTFGEQIARSAGYAIVFSLLLIAAYVAFRFEAKYAVPVMIAVVHDILITAGVYSLVGREVSSATVAAFLTILGYSLYDTVIVFDRVRENVPRLPRATFSQIANRSLSEVLTRSLITGLSTVFLISVILIFGGETLRTSPSR